LPPIEPEAAELAVLLATGLARSKTSSRRFLLLFSLIILSALAAGWTFGEGIAAQDKRIFWLAAATFAGCLTSFFLYLRSVRVHIFRADQLAVDWLGRETMCQGLHQLADRVPLRSRFRPHHLALRLLSEPALTERIARVCDSHVQQHDDRLTLVR
jgi:Zn-dependent protease with chaperone function